MRVLLLARKRTGLARDALDGIEDRAPATLTQVLDHVQDNPAADRPLTVEQRVMLYHQAVARFTTAWCPDTVAEEDGDGQPAVPDLGHDRYGLALEVLFEALDRALTRCGDDAAAERPGPGGGGGGGGRLPAERALDHEEKYWQFTAPADCRNDAGLLRECAGLATLAGAGDLQEAHALLSIPGGLARAEAAQARQGLIGWLSAMYDGPRMLNPLRPDRLGEALVARVLRDQEDDGQTMLGAVLGLSDEQAERCLDVLGRLSTYDAATATTAAAALSRAHINLTPRAEEQSHAAPGRPGRTDLAGALQRLLTTRFCSMVEQALADDEPGNTTYRRDLSVSFERLADLARAAGQGDEARQWVSRALDARRRLVRDEPGRLDLAVELAYVLYLSTTTGARPANDPSAAAEAASILEPFERLGLVTTRALALLAWARRNQ